MTASLSDELKKYIDEQKVFATVATILPDGQPHLTVVWIKRDGEDLVFSTTAQRLQGRNLARDPRITVMINPPENPYTYAAVRGTATLTPDTTGELADELALKFTGQDFTSFMGGNAVDGDRLIVRVTPAKVTGRF
ncbi:PPOX class F420-dependent oxidoreductase [Streptomyces sp. NPDC093546]|uniref:PPOX class F420-dependent oxidoreductase n=1 Tax=Streptomyces sp. NPDC093546 TaxID=3366040 RepID=UPI0037F534C1